MNISRKPFFVFSRECVMSKAYNESFARLIDCHAAKSERAE
jgi:hypothetical protein